MECKFCKGGGDIIFKTKFWSVQLARGQAYIGRCLVVYKEHGGSLSELSKEVWDDFTMVVRKLENALRKAFNATLFNWTCLMNHGFTDKNLEPGKSYGPHIHWHFRPRYSHPVEIGGLEFEDKEFGYHYVDGSVREREVPDDVRKMIIAKIRKNL